MARTNIKAIDSNTAAPATAVQRPVEEKDALALREIVMEIHATAATRTVLTEEDHNKLDTSETQAAVYISTANVRWQSEAETSAPHVVTSLGEAIAEYVNTMRAEVTLSLGAGIAPVITPAIESATVRGVLVRKGAAILEQIDKAIAAGYSRLATIAEKNRQRREQLTYWMTNHPPVRSLVRAAAELMTYTESGACDLGGPTSHVVDAIANATRHLAHGDERAGRIPPEYFLFSAAGAWRRWLPVAIELLNEETKPERGAA